MTHAVRPVGLVRRRTDRRALFRLTGRSALAVVALTACDREKLKRKASSSASAETGAAPPQPFPEDRRVHIQHLFRRAGFAPSEAEVQRGLDLGPDRLIEELLNPERMPDTLSPALAALDLTAEPRPDQLAAWWLERMVATARPSLERMTFFWHGFHPSGFDKLGRRVGPMYQQNVFQRETAFGRYTDILKGISRQPAMMIYLDTITNVRGRPNENYARELLELFSLGVGNYTETDVREAARAFTGYSLDNQTQTFLFRPGLHDPGPKTVLGRTGNLTGDDVVDIVMQQPAVSRFVARRLWQAFAYPEVDDATLAPVAKAFADSGGDMRTSLRAVLTHPAFTSPPAYRALVKGPVEFAVGAVRQLGLVVPGQTLAAWCRLMGQIPFFPPNVAGWPGGAAWMASGTFLARLNGLQAVLSGGRLPGARLPGPAPSGAGPAAADGLDVDRYLDTHQLATVGAVVDHFLTLLVDGQVPRAVRAALVDYAASSAGDNASLAAMAPSERRRRVQGLAYLIMAGPQYHLA